MISLFVRGDRETIGRLRELPYDLNKRVIRKAAELAVRPLRSEAKLDGMRLEGEIRQMEDVLTISQTFGGRSISPTRFRTHAMYRAFEAYGRNVTKKHASLIELPFGERLLGIRMARRQEDYSQEEGKGYMLRLLKRRGMEVQHIFIDQVMAVLSGGKW